MKELCLSMVLFGCFYLVSGCGDRREIAHPAATSTPAPAHEIAWAQGSVEEAMATATKERKLLLIYWGAKWCPYCQALKNTVFTRQDFIEKSTLFVPVYLDGDLPGAQAWGETFKVSGYPTLLILKPDRTELARMSGGMDLSQYASLLDEALQDQRPILGVLATASRPEECHRLSYYGWDPQALQLDAARLAELLTSAAARCAGSDQVRLQLSALNFGLQDNAEHARAEQQASLKEQIQNFYTLLAQPLMIRPAIDLISGFDDALFSIVTQQGGDFAGKFRDRWVARMQEAANDERYGDADRLIAVASVIDATKALTRDHSIPLVLQQSARDRIEQALKLDRDRFKRSDLVNAANIVYGELGDYDAAREMYLKELPNTRTPYYYMSHLAAILEKQGKPQEALDWMAKAYASSEGPATRLRWGSSYVRALIRLSPEDTARIRTAGLQVAAELSSSANASRSDVPRGRSRSYVEQIDKALKGWASTPKRRAVAAEVIARFPHDTQAQPT